MKFAIISLVLLPPILLLSAWVSMQIKLIPVRRETTEEDKEELRRALGYCVLCFQVLCLAIQKQNERKLNGE
jgi:hypothetical protein